MDNWKNDFESLYDPIDQNEFDDVYHSKYYHKKSIYEDNPTET